MSKYSCLIVDDEELARELLASHLSQFNEFELIASCASAIEASQVLKQQAVDLIFLDIEMPVLNGTDFYRSLVHKPQVIFTTAYRDYAVDGFDLDAVDYLLKPIFFARFFNAIDKFLAIRKHQNHNPVDELQNVLSTNQNNHIFVRKDRKQVKIIFDEILYVSGLKDYIKIHTVDQIHVVKYGMTAFEKQLPSQFIRVHRSYIVNQNKITAYSQHDIEIDQIEIPIGVNFRQRLNQILLS